jgi:phytoene desaturase
MQNNKKILVVGAGPGGLTSAMILASKGFDVEVFEKNEIVGGRNGEVKKDGFTFDIGPTFLMMKFILDEVFKEAGENSEDYLKFSRLDPMYRLVFEDFKMDIFDDRQKMKNEIKSLFPGQEGGLDKFLNKESKRFEKVYPIMQKNQDSFWNFFTPVFLKALPYIPLGKSLFDYLGNYFAPEKLKLAFTFQAKYLGMSPFECPGFFIILPYVEHKFGIFHVEGGLSMISKKMAEVIGKKGGKVHLNAGVKQVILKDKKAIGLELLNGEKVFGDEVIMNADFAYAMNELMPKKYLKKYTPEKLAKKKYSCSTYMIYLGIKGEYPEMKHHTIVFSENYKKNVNDIFKTLEVSEDFSMYVRNASVIDKTVAPEGMSNLYILVPMPNNKSGTDWEKEKTSVRERVLDLLEKRTQIKDIRNIIVTEHIITPLDWEHSGVYMGAVFNLAHSFDQLLMLRPHNKFEEADNMYLVGGGTHPGSGLPTIYESGRIAANMISKKYNIS